MTPRQGSGPTDPMDCHTGEVLGFPRVLGLLAEGAETPQGRARCLALAPLPAPEVAREVLDEVAALGRLEPERGLPPTGGMQAVEVLLDQARLDGSCLDVEALLAVRDTVAACQRVYEYLEEAQSKNSRQLSKYLPVLRFVERGISIMVESGEFETALSFCDLAIEIGLNKAYAAKKASIERMTP